MVRKLIQAVLGVIGVEEALKTKGFETRKTLGRRAARLAKRSSDIPWKKSNKLFSMESANNGEADTVLFLTYSWD